jgi:hypothetical protein
MSRSEFEKNGSKSFVAAYQVVANVENSFVNNAEHGRMLSESRGRRILVGDGPMGNGQRY